MHYAVGVALGAFALVGFLLFVLLVVFDHVVDNGWEYMPRRNRFLSVLVVGLDFAALYFVFYFTIKQVGEAVLKHFIGGA